jgi:hypothetical protein
MTWNAESFEIKSYCSSRWKDKWDEDKWSQLSIDDQSMQDVCLDQDTWDDVLMIETKRITRLFVESCRLWFYFNEWKIQRWLLN